jgi:hypothetical protein
MEILNYAPNSRLCTHGRAIGIAAVLSLAMTLGNFPAGASEQPIDEYQVKAAFIYNFAKFVQWPAEAFQTAKEPIAICVLGEDPFGSFLEDTIAGRTIEGRPLTIRHIASDKQVAGCHILFFGSGDDKRVTSAIADIRTPGILTIGDSEISGVDGVVINFRLEAGKVRFDINVEAAGREKLLISSRLLSLARIVDPTRK